MTKILMSPERPDGHKLEELLPLVIEDLNLKAEKVLKSTHPEARRVAHNNRAIVELPTQAQRYQLDTQAALDRIGPDQGPRGKPRL